MEVNIVSITLDQQALVALHDPAFEKMPGYCQRFVRQCIEALYGDDYERFEASSALRAAKRWRQSDFAHDPRNGSQIGDILYYEHGHGPFGHVAIRVPGNQVAENSVVHRSRKNGGKGTRTLEAVGEPSLIVRLPPLKVQTR
jgi:hypothetical protein